MWEPDPSWRALRAGPGSAGLWAVADSGRAWVVKRVERPAADEYRLSRAEHAGYWRREAEVARRPGFVDGPGLVPPPYGQVEEDEDGILVWSEEVAGDPPPGLFVARALGRFAGAAYDEAPDWASQRLLADRLAMAAERGGWPTLARTTLADVTEHLWQRRGHWLARLDETPTGRLHGDAVPSNFVAARGEDVVAVDWRCTGTGPVGTDLGYFALSSREGFDVLVDTFVAGAQDEDPGLTGAAVEAIAVAARVTAVYSVLARAEWALERVARGEGALAGKYRHPAVAPHLRAVERLLPQVELLLS
ncbi:MAG: phosphotransferase [Marmoricola sp.]|nr:phosphotransferase [Marmoricola sp.]